MDYSKIIFRVATIAGLICVALCASPTSAHDEIVEEHAADTNGAGALAASPDDCSASMTPPRVDQGRAAADEECSTDADCDDGLNCTRDTCGPDLRCVYEVKPTYCAVDGACYKDLHTNPLNECQYCDIYLDREHWTPQPPGTPCGDSTGSLCDFADTCNAYGECLDNHVQDGTPCPDNEFCNGSEVCAAGVCQSGQPACAWPGLVCDEAYAACHCQSGFNCAVLHVDLDAPGPPTDGLSWETAYRDLQAALDHAAGSAGAVTQIHVAQGIYRPSRPADPADPRTATFPLVDGTSLKGGYAGFGADNPHSRHTRLFETTLSGDLNDDDGGDLNDPSRSENAYQVLTAVACGDKTIIDGFTITGGQADGPGPRNTGAGLYSLECSTVVNNCTFIKNSAVLGGAIYHISDGSESTPTVTNCTFRQNVASFQGGGMWNGESHPTVINCVFDSNSAYSGGAISSNASDTTLANCTLVGNTAQDRGGGIATVSGITFLTGCILWDNHDSSGTGPSAQIHGVATVTYTDVLGGWPGLGNLDRDPVFVGDSLRLGPGSPCIDAGDNRALPGDLSLDLDGRLRFIEDPHTPDTGNGTPPVVDQGAYEYQPHGEVRTNLDIMPGDCPNILSRRNPQLLRIALVGTDTLAAKMVDVASLVLARADGVGGTIGPLMEPASVGPALLDETTPFEDVQCGCHVGGPDGFNDLVLTFPTAKVADALEFDFTTPESFLILTLNGSLVDHNLFEASGCVVLAPLNQPPPSHRRKGRSR